MLGAGARRGKRVAFQDESNKRTAAEMSMQDAVDEGQESEGHSEITEPQHLGTHLKLFDATSTCS